MSSRRLDSMPNAVVAFCAAAAIWLCLFSGLSAIGLTGPDEPRYAWIARNMAERGNWVTPILYGKPWFEKPILYYWAAAADFTFLHSPEMAARLPSALAALAAALAMGWLAWRRYGAATAAATLLIFPSCVGVVAFSRAATPDMLFTSALALALVCAASLVEKHGGFAVAEEPKPRADAVALVFLGVWLGVATLAKGPAAILLAGGSVVLWALVTKHWRAAFRMLHPIALLSFCAVALPWYVLCSLRNPDFFRTFIVFQNFERYLTPVFQHRQPFWFFGPILLIGLLPWTALLGGVALDARRIWHEKSVSTSPGFFIACWTIFPIVFFSFSQSKLPSYILPAFPPLALLLAHSLVRAIKRAPRTAQWLGIATGILWTLLGVAGSVAFLWLHAHQTLSVEERRHFALTAVLVGLVAGIVIEVLSLTRRPRSAIFMTAAFVAVSIGMANLWVLPKLDSLLSTRRSAGIWKIEPNSAAAKVPLYQLDLNRDCAYGLAFYRGQYPEDWSSNVHRPALVLAGPSGEKELANLPGVQKINGAGAEWPPCGVLYYAAPAAITDRPKAASSAGKN